MRTAVIVLMVSMMSSGVYAQSKPPRREPQAPMEPAAPPPADSCAQASASARYVGYGYTHVVTVTNGCAKPVECTVWTDVDPEPRVVVRLASSERTEVVTRRGSPARAVTAFKSCRYR